MARRTLDMSQPAIPETVLAEVLEDAAQHAEAAEPKSGMKDGVVTVVLRFEPMESADKNKAALRRVLEIEFAEAFDRACAQLGI